MKKFLLVSLAILFCIGGGAYYTYLTDEGFKYNVDALLKENKGSKISDSLHREPDLPKKQIVNRPRVPKTINPDKFFKIDEFARKTPKLYEKDVETLANYLVSGGQTEIEKVRAIFTWVATHIRYDDEAFNSGKLGDYPAEKVLLEKKAVCEGYGNLLKELCSAAGFESEKIVGYAKGYGYKDGDKFTETDHAWNAVKIGDRWKLFDATWANGYGINKNGKLVSVDKFDPYWFDVNPKEFIFSHLPEDSKWQLNDEVITLNKYETLPYLHGFFFQLGFDSDKIFKEAVSGNVKAYAEVYPVDFPVKAIRLPHHLDLVKSDTIEFAIESDYAEEFALIDGSKWYYFKRSGNRFELTHRPASNSVEVCQKINWYDRSFHTIIKYSLKSSESL